MKNKPTVVFCASVKHAEEIAELFRRAGIEAMCISGGTKAADRKQILADYESGKLPVLCACDLLNEGWDSPHTQVLFMARPTMSKTIYIQQLGRGMRKSPGKDFLMVFDFVDNTNMFNVACSIHRMHHSKHLGTLQFNKALVRQLTDEDYAAIRESCHAAIARYFGTAKA